MSTVDTQINANLRQAHALEGKISSARVRADKAQRRMQEFEERCKQVQTIKGRLSNSFDGVVSAIQRNQDKTKGAFGNATSGFKRESALVDRIASDRERHTEADLTAGQVHSNLQSEINRCQNEAEKARAEMNAARNEAASLVNQRNALVNRAQSLSYRDGATVKVREKMW